MDDVRAVLDAVGSERAALFGSLDGGAILTLFAATYPERSVALVLFATEPRWTKAPGYPWGFGPEEARAWVRDGEERFADWNYMRDFIARLSPSIADDDELLDWMGRAWRLSNSPGSLAAFRRMNMEIDIRDVLPTVQVPTLVLQRREETFVPPEVARYVADRIPGATYQELPGADFIPWFGDSATIVETIRDFVTRAWTARAWEREPDRVLATVLFTDVVDSTQTAVEVGDARWRELLETHRRDVRTQLARFRGRELDTAGDGFFATFDGPARAIRCASAIVGDPGELSVRAGLHTGECELIENKVGGIAVHIGARVAGKAGAGEVLVSGTVKDLVAGSGIAFDDRGVHELKGIPGEWRLYAVSADPRPFRELP
jgi:class 3 adenylate cyclase